PHGPPAPTGPSVTDYIFVGNLNAAYSGRALCRNNIDSVIDTSGSPALSLIPCTCSRRTRHSWSRLKVDMELAPGDAPTLQQRCFQDINGCMEASAERKKRVLVHCGDGSSLAPTVVIQYLMVKHHMRLLPAYELLRSRHPLNIRERHELLFQRRESFFFQKHIGVNTVVLFGVDSSSLTRLGTIYEL
uniref:protein-tyrosine-phosphatase n=1 Tax=Gadus morhua TaxID=8049 RepID=A0A8C5BCB0_GADMO